MKLVLPAYSAHPYFPSKIWAKSAHYTWQNTVSHLVLYHVMDIQAKNLKHAP